MTGGALTAIKFQRREDQNLKRRAERSLLILGEGRLPTKKKQRPSIPSNDNSLLSRASIAGNPGCFAGGVGDKGVSRALPRVPSPSARVSGCAGIERKTSERSGGERGVDGGDEEGVEDDDVEDGEEEAYTVWGDDQRVPPAQAVFIQKVIECAKKGLSTATSHIYRPLDPVKGFHKGMTFEEFSVSAVHVICWHLFYAQQGLPRFPPCPRHGWKAVQQSQVESKGWTKGRRVYGLSKDEYLVGTRHSCGLCKAEKRTLQEQAAGWDGNSAEKAKRVKAARSHQYIYSSYDPMVTQWYVDSFPFIADKMTVVISTRKTAVTKELKTLAQRLGSSPYELMNLRKDMRAMQTAGDRATFESLQHMVNGSEAREDPAETSESIGGAQMREPSPCDTVANAVGAQVLPLGPSRQPGTGHVQWESFRVATAVAPPHPPPPPPPPPPPLPPPPPPNGVVDYGDPSQSVGSTQASSLKITLGPTLTWKEDPGRDQGRDQDPRLDAGLEKAPESAEGPSGVESTSLGWMSGRFVPLRRPSECDANGGTVGKKSAGVKDVVDYRGETQGSSERPCESTAAAVYATRSSGGYNPNQILGRVSSLASELKPGSMPGATDAMLLAREDSVKVSGRTPPVRLMTAAIGGTGQRSVGGSSGEAPAVEGAHDPSARGDLSGVHEDEAIDVTGGGQMTMAGGDFAMEGAHDRPKSTPGTPESSGAPLLGDQTESVGWPSEARHSKELTYTAGEDDSAQSMSLPRAPTPKVAHPEGARRVQSSGNDQGIVARNLELETAFIIGTEINPGIRKGTGDDASSRIDSGVLGMDQSPSRQRSPGAGQQSVPALS